MKKVNNIKELIDFSYNKYKSKKAITIESEYEKNINYFNLKFDIYSLARALKSKRTNIKEQKVAILSENRYEFLITYLANLIVKNTVVIIDSNLEKTAIEKAIKKHQINTIFFSNKNKDKIIEIYKINEKNKNNKRKIVNLINFDPTNKFPIIEYEKLMNIGRYIENYSIDNYEGQEENNKYKNTIIVDKEGTREYYEQDILETTYIIGENIKLKKKKKIEPLYDINSFYKIVMEILLPISYGLNIQYGMFEDYTKKIENIKIEHDSKKEVIITYRNNNYRIQNIGKETNVVKLNTRRRIWHKNKQIEGKGFVLIKTEKNKGNKQIDTSFSIIN